MPRDPRHPVPPRRGPRAPTAAGLAAVAGALLATSSALPPPPLGRRAAGTWLADLGPTMATLALARLLVALVLARLALATAVALVARWSRRRVVADLALVLAGPLGRAWAQRVAGAGLATAVLVPGAAGALPARGADEPPPPSLVLVEEAPATGRAPAPGGPSVGTPADPSTGEVRPAPRFELVEVLPTPPAAPPGTGTGAPVAPPSHEPPPVPSQEPAPGAAPVPPPATTPHDPSAPEEPPRPSAAPAGPSLGSPPRPSTGSPPAPSGRGTAATAPATPGEWVIAPGQHLWHVAEATARELAPGAGTADVARYHRRLIAANLDRLPVPSDPDLVHPGNVIRRPAWAP